jgi:hypothetical protein
MERQGSSHGHLRVKGLDFSNSCFQLRWMYQYPGLSPDLDLVVSQPVPTHIRSPFSQRLHQNPAFGGRGLRGDAAILFVGV